MPFKLDEHELEKFFYVPWIGLTLDPKNNKIICQQRQKNPLKFSKLLRLLQTLPRTG